MAAALRTVAALAAEQRLAYGFESSRQDRVGNDGCVLVKVRLIKKLAECIDGVLLTGRRVGDVIDLSPREADLLLAHGWAVMVDPIRPRSAELPGGQPPARFLDEPLLTVRVSLRKDDESA